MLRGLLFLSVFVVFGFNGFDANADESKVTQDAEYVRLKEKMLKNEALGFGNLSAQRQKCSTDQGDCQTDIELFVQGLDELLFDRKISRRAGWTLIDEAINSDIDTLSKLQIAITFQNIYKPLQKSLRTDLFDEILRSEKDGRLSQRTKIFLLSNAAALPANWNELLVSFESDVSDVFGQVRTSTPRDRYQMARDLIKVEPNLAAYSQGKYLNKPRIYMFCRSKRDYQCLMVMKNKNGQIHQKSDGTIWTQPSLGLSRHGKIFSQTNGNTPAGVFRIDGVMPDNDDQLVFGKFRRLILNFVGATTGESMQKNLLPPSSHSDSWWQEAVVARNNGRGLFRIHGTGLRSNRFKDYYPLVPTSGCVAKRENTYGSTTYKDQREMLDELMLASGLNKTTANETKIVGLLYVFNIDDKTGAVKLSELQSLGVL